MALRLDHSAGLDMWRGVAWRKIAYFHNAKLVYATVRGVWHS